MCGRKIWWGWLFRWKWWGNWLGLLKAGYNRSGGWNICGGKWGWGNIRRGGGGRGILLGNIGGCGRRGGRGTLVGNIGGRGGGIGCLGSNGLDIYGWGSIYLYLLIFYLQMV